MIGVYVGARFKPGVDEAINTVGKLVQRKPAEPDAGPVKPITKIEREAEQQKAFRDRMKFLTSDPDHPVI